MWHGFEQREVKRVELPPEIPAEWKGAGYGLLFGLIMFWPAIMRWVS